MIMIQAKENCSLLIAVSSKETIRRKVGQTLNLSVNTATLRLD